MNKKYQIFVSSTFEDLKEQRDLVIKAILEMGHIPVGMEMFSAADEEQWNIIKRQIDESDYYIVIIANRYGSISDSGISYTEKEYDYALSKGIPALGFILNSTSSWPSNYTDTLELTVSALNTFKEKVKQKHVSFWKNTDDLYGKCSIALMKSFTAYPREGWARASSVTDVKFTSELARLSAENSVLRKQIEELGLEEKKEHEDDIAQTLSLLAKNKRSLTVWLKKGTDWDNDGEVTLMKVFRIIAPELLIEKSIPEISIYLASMLSTHSSNDLRDTYPLPSNTIKNWMADFSTLSLVKPSDRKKPVTNTDDYWTLTQKGKDLLNRIRKIVLENAPEESTIPDEIVPYSKTKNTLSKPKKK